MTERTEDFYDRLAGDHHFFFDDWERAVVRQGKILDSLLRQRGLPVPARIFDCACGIGTQALGLAGRGHVVAGSDASVAAITRARAEAAKRGLDVAFTVADMRTLAGLERAAFDAVVCADNALPHLMSAAELRATTGAIAACLKPGGLFLGSIRDYDAALLQRPTAVPPRFLDKGGPHRIIHQIWEWLDEERPRGDRLAHAERERLLPADRAREEGARRSGGLVLSLEIHDIRKTPVIARRPKGAEAIRQELGTKRPGLLRCARNDGYLRVGRTAKSGR